MKVHDRIADRAEQSRPTEKELDARILGEAQL